MTNQIVMIPLLGQYQNGITHAPSPLTPNSLHEVNENQCLGSSQLRLLISQNFAMY